MKYCILTFVLFVFGCKASREKPPTLELNEPNLIECDSMKKKAETDFKNGVLEYDILGTVEMTEFESFYWEYMQEKYKIVIKSSDQPSFLEECYAESMNYEIEEEYGKDFMKLTREKAEMEFKKQRK